MHPKSTQTSIDHQKLGTLKTVENHSNQIKHNYTLKAPKKYYKFACFYTPLNFYF
jgi:hypothetical protein